MQLVAVELGQHQNWFQENRLGRAQLPDHEGSGARRGLVSSINSAFPRPVLLKSVINSNHFTRDPVCSGFSFSFWCLVSAAFSMK